MLDNFRVLLCNFSNQECAVKKYVVFFCCVCLLYSYRSYVALLTECASACFL